MTEEEYLDSLKKEDHYHFSVPFEYIRKNYGNGNYDIGVLTMEVDVDWSDDEHGYVSSWYCSEEHRIDPAEGNSDLKGFYDFDVEYQVKEKLAALGIYDELLVG